MNKGVDKNEKMESMENVYQKLNFSMIDNMFG